MEGGEIAILVVGIVTLILIVLYMILWYMDNKTEIKELIGKRRKKNRK